MKFIILFIFAIYSTTALCYGENQIRIGINPWPGYDFLKLAEKVQIFKNNNLNVKLIYFASLSDMNNAYQRGQLDGFASTAVDAYFNHQRNLRNPAQIILAVDYSYGADVFIGGAKLNSLNQLKNKTIGLEVMSLGNFMLSRILAKQGLKESDVVLKSMSQVEMKEALQKGLVDGVITYPPASLEVKKIQNSKVLFNSKEIAGEVLDVMALSEKVIKANPELPQKIADCFLEAIEYREKNKDKADAIMAAHEGISVQDWRNSFAEIKMITAEEFKVTLRNGKLLLQVLNDIETAMKKNIKNPVEWNIENTLKPVFGLKFK